MLVFGFGISTDVNNLTFAVLDHDQTHESRAYLEELRGSTYFVEQPPLDRLCRSGEAPAERSDQGRHRNSAGLRPRPRARTSGLGRRLGRWRHAVPRRDHPRLSAGHAPALSDAIRRSRRPRGSVPQPARIELRFKYNQNFESVFAMVPTDMSLMLALFPAILMALASRAGKGARLDHQSLRHAGHADRVPAWQADSLYRPSPW